MSVRERIRQIKHLQNKYFICVLENPDNLVNVASAIRNIFAFGVEKLYVVGGADILKDFESSRTNKHLTNISVGANKWVFVKHFDTTSECIQIPMGGIVESLNLGTSTGIILSCIGYQRLRFVFSHEKVHFKPKGIARLKMRSWQDFLGLRR